MKPASAEIFPAQNGAPGPGARTLWIARPSVIVATLAGLSAVYFGGALAFAGLEAWRTQDLRIPIFGAAILVLICVASQIRWAWGILAVMAASFYAQYEWALWLDPQPFGEFGHHWELARRLASGLRAGAVDWSVLQISPSPTATGFYALAIWGLGDDFSALRLVAAGLWTLQTFLVWRIASEVSELRPRAFAISLVFGLSPTVIAFGSLPSVEAVFGVFALTAVYLLLSHRRRGLELSAFLSGVVAALAFLTQPAALGFGLAILAILVFGLFQARGWRSRLQIVSGIVFCALGVVVGLSPQAALNYERDGQLSLAPGPALGYQLLLGTNRASEGGYSQADLERLGFISMNGEPISPEALVSAGRAAEREALSRVTADPLGFALFAATDKMRHLWSSEREMLGWSVGSPSTRAEGYRGSLIARYAPQAVYGAYLAVLLLAFAGSARLLFRSGAVTDPARWLLLLGSVVGLALAFTVLEARERHHLAFMPLLALLAPLPFVRLPWIAWDYDRATPALPASRPVAQAAAAPVRAKAQPARTQPDRREPELPQKTPAKAPAPVVAAARKPAQNASQQTNRPVSEMSAEERLAKVLRGMSKPPRPADEAREEPPQNGAAKPKTPSADAERAQNEQQQAAARRVPPVLAPPPKKQSSAV